VSERSATNQYYWSWTERLKGEHYKRFCGTAPEQLVFALGEALALIREETLQGCIERHTRLATMVRAAVSVWSEAKFFEFNALIANERANSVTTIRVPEDFDAERIRNAARQQHNLIIGGGLGNLRGKIIRIGHMGFINTPYVLGALGALEQVFRDLEIPIGRGALEAALAG
jgi:alanine-glyoxylate transaminase/serine-glyoxylate transaminase/serine-pyruvate transaminase